MYTSSNTQHQRLVGLPRRYSHSSVLILLFSHKLRKIGYWISLVGAVRAAFLALILPGKVFSNAQRMMHY